MDRVEVETAAKHTDGEKGNWTAAEGEEKEEVECDGGGFGELTHPWRHDLGWLSGGRLGGGGWEEGWVRSAQRNINISLPRQSR